MSAGEYGQDGAGRLLAGRYRVVRRLGRGGMGVVHQAVDEVLGRDVAVKELRTFSDASGGELTDLRLRMQREARAAARVNHPGVIAVYDVAEDDGRPLIVMELVGGPSLDDVLRDHGLLDPRDAAAVGAKVMDALGAAHRAGVLHRDVKPGNVLFGGGDDSLGAGRVVLTDFGIASMDDPGDGGATRLTHSGDIVGSLDYLAPERCQGQEPGPASDVWSLGATLYAAVEGASPFRRTSTWSTLTAIVSEPLPEPSRAGPLTPVLRALLDKDPQARPTAEHAREMLEAVAAGRPYEGAAGGSAAGPAAGGAAGAAGLGADAPTDRHTMPVVPGFGPAPDFHEEPPGGEQRPGQPSPQHQVPQHQVPPRPGPAGYFPQPGAHLAGPGAHPAGPAGPGPAGPGAGSAAPGAGPAGPGMGDDGPLVAGGKAPPSPWRRRRTAVAAAVAIVVLAAAGATAAVMHGSGEAGKVVAQDSSAAASRSPERTPDEGKAVGKKAGRAKPPHKRPRKPRGKPAAGHGGTVRGGASGGSGPGGAKSGDSGSGGGTSTGGDGGSSSNGGGGSSGGTTGGGGNPAPAPVCHPIGGGKYNCQVWRRAKSYNNAGRQVGVLNAGTNYFFCQRKGRRETYGQWTNIWWAKTDDDSGHTGVFVSDVYIKGGDNDKPLPGLPIC